MEGPRLLVGRYCLLDEHRTMQVMQYNQNDTVKLRSVQTGEPAQDGKDISLSRVKKIERYGVSVYDASKLPEQISKSHYAWTCSIKTKDRSLLQTLLTKISQANVEKTFKKRKPTFERKSGIASGKVIISIVEAKNLRQSEALKSMKDPAHFQPYVKVSVEVLEPGLKPRQLGKSFATSTAKPEQMSAEGFKELLKVASWRTVQDPTGQTIALGDFQKNMKSKEAIEKRSSLVMTLEAMQQLAGQLSQARDMPDKADPEHIFLKFQVFHKSPGAEPLLLGSSLLKATRVIDLDKIWSSQQMLLLLPKEGVQEPSHNAILQKKENKKKKNTSETESSEEELDAPYGADQLLPHAEFQDPTAKHTLAGTLQINTLFIPDTETRHQFALYDDYSIFKIPEARMHYSTLMNARMFDNYHYAVPMNFYDPRDHTVERYVESIDINGRPRVLKSHDEMDLYQQQLKQEFMQERNLPEAKRLIRQQRSINIAIKKKIFSCPEEITDFYLWLKNHNRPMRQSYTSDFTKMWLAHCLQISYDARKKINRFLWQQYLADLIGSGEMVALDEEQLKQQASQNTSKRRTTFVTGSIEALHQQTKIRANNPSYAHQHSLAAPSKGDETAYSLIMHNKKNNILMFSGIWEKQQDQKYADLHYLIHAGIPDELRPTIWKELLKAEIVEVEEIENYKAAYGSQYPYDKTKTLFANYTLISDKSDCLAFKQIDEDVGKFNFGNSYQDNSQNPDEKDLIQRTEKYQMRSLLRVLILWSKQRKLSGADVCITYGDGFMRLIQRMITITHSEEDCFWILTGIIRSFPRPFAVTGSVLNSDCDSVMRYEMTAFKAMLQQNLPAVHEKLKDYGLPVEFLVYKSVMSFYADYFTSEVVLRLWDIIIFNFSSSDKTERKRGLWWLLSPAYYVLREKQKNILKAKSCTEIKSCLKSYDSKFFGN